jgi:hypothetical protein
MSEQEKNKQAHLNEINWLKKEIAFLERVQKTTTHEPSRQSLSNTIEIYKGSQEKLSRSLYAKHGITADESEKAKKSDADKLVKYGERVASQGVGAMDNFYNSAQFDAGTLKDIANRAVPAQEPPPTEQEKIVQTLLDLKNQEKAISQQLVSLQKSLSPEEIKALEKERAQKWQAYTEKFGQVIQRPDKEQIIKMWEAAKIQEYKIEREKEQDKEQTRTK